MSKPTVTHKQLADDLAVIVTTKRLRKVPTGYRIRMMHDISLFGKVKPSQRWYRVWEKTQDTIDGWKYQGLAFGISSEVSEVA